MLASLEGKLVAVAADALKSRPHLDVVRATKTNEPPQPGRGVIRIGIESVAPDQVFERSRVAFQNLSRGRTTSRRVLPVKFTTVVHCARRPSTGGESHHVAARTALLDDMSLLAHAFAASELMAGAALTVIGDPGFSVSSYALVGGEVVSPVEPGTAGLLGADAAVAQGILRYHGLADLWPPAEPEKEGMIDVVDTVVAALPVGVSIDPPVVRAGSTATVRVTAGRVTRATGVDRRERALVAVAVVSGLPPEERGRLTGGTEGAETSVRILPLEQAEVAATYVAPDTRASLTESISVHLATPDGRRGILLAAATIGVRGSR